MKWTICCGGLILLASWGCQSRSVPPATHDPIATDQARITMKLTSSAFQDGQVLDTKFTEDGTDVSPPLAWSDIPDGTKSLALICDDPDAPSPSNPGPKPWVHWVLYNVAPNVDQLPEGVERSEKPVQVGGACQGVNSWSKDNLGYRGPAPPAGSGVHRYVFTIYALDTALSLSPGATKDQLVEAMKGHILAEGRLIGKYERKK